MKPGALKTTMWYKCLVCHTCFQFPKALVIHRMKSQCRFKYKEIHKERSRWPFETLRLENLKEEKVLHLKDWQRLLKYQKTVEKVQETPKLEPIKRYCNEVKDSVPEMPKQSRNLDLNQVMSCVVDPLPRNQEQLKCHCYFCSSIFTNFEDLKKHMMSHTREKSDELKSGSCHFDNCKKNGMRILRLKLHKISTSGKFICSLCLKSFFSEHYLNLHTTSIHKRLKPYSCKQCPRFFSQSSNLRIHVSCVHKRLRPYSCKTCAKMFSLIGNLKRHISSVHEKLRPYACQQCPKSFGQLVNLKTHVSGVHTLVNRA